MYLITNARAKNDFYITSNTDIEYRYRHLNERPLACRVADDNSYQIVVNQMCIVDREHHAIVPM